MPRWARQSFQAYSLRSLRSLKTPPLLPLTVLLADGRVLRPKLGGNPTLAFVAELGEVVSPGTSIVTLADINHVWLRAYVNEPDIGKIRLGQSVDVTTDSYPGKHYSGKLSFISEVAEFTPKSVETHAERVTLVYRIRIDLDNPTHELAPGLPADARLHLFGPGSQ